ncbi:hypothetical protein [Actinophytocola sp.]|uniref:hypothetical protein n=1 Tax=Actinophytocola sp. TaxID=1872138 RepID=UPI00389B1C6B
MARAVVLAAANVLRVTGFGDLADATPGTDLGLLHAKRGGRNRVRHADADALIRR